MDSKFFNKMFASDYKKHIKESFLRDIESMSDDKFSQYDNETLIDYFYNRLDLNALTIHDKSSPKIEMAKRIDEEEQYNYWSDFGMPNQPKYYKVKVENIYWKYTVRLTGNLDFAYLMPSTYSGSLSTEDYKNLEIKELNGKEYNLLIVTLKKSVADAEKIDDIKESIDKLFLGSLALFEKNLQSVNNEILKNTNDIKKFIKETVENRKHSIGVSSSIFEKFNIPMNSTDKIKFAEPLIIQKNNVSLPNIENKKKTEYYIKVEDVEKIDNLIYSFCSTMERTPQTYIQSGEEDIRNTILAALNTQFSNATGETFSNSGKTDIFVGKYNSAAYIAECKIWKGKEVLLQAIKQLLSYTSYKECQGTIILLNKNNSNFSKILTEIPSIVNSMNNTTCKNVDNNIFKFSTTREDGSIFNIKIMIFNFYYKQ